MTAFSPDDLNQHAHGMRRLARDLLVDATLADDAVQQAWVTALQRPPAAPFAVGRWLRAVVRSCALDLLRSEGRRRRREQLAVREDSNDPVDAAQRLELQESIVAAVRALGEPYTTAVWLRYYEGQTPAEIARRLGEPPKTIKTRLWRALQLLRTRLDGRDGGRSGWLAAITPIANVSLTTVGWGAANAAGAWFMQSKLAGAAAAAIVILAAGGALLWRAPTTLPSPAADRATLAAAQAAAGDSPAANAAIANPTDAVAATREAVASTPPVPAGPSVQVRVVAPDGTFVAGATLLRDASPGDPARWKSLAEAERRRLQWDSEAWLRHFGSAVVTDAEGIARWPWEERERSHWHIVVRHGELYGETSVSMLALASELHELRLAPDRAFAVRFVDAQQQPASDVRVAVRFAQRDDPRESSSQTLGITDADGQLLARHVQTWSDRVAPQGSRLPVSVEVDLPGIECGREVDVHDLSAEPILMSLPPTGSFEIAVRDAGGQPIAGEHLSFTEDAKHPGRQFETTTDDRGIACFPWVGLGRSWRLGRNHAPPDRFSLHPGPRMAGERTRVTLQPEPLPVLVGQLLRDGAPLAGATLEVTAANRSPTNDPVVTDASGHFRILAASSHRDRPLTDLTLRPMSTERGFDGDSATWRGDVVMVSGVSDLGVLTLQPEPIVAAVQFVTARGTVPDRLGFAVEAAIGSAEAPWQSVQLYKRFEPEGRYTVFGTAPNAALRLSVSTENRCLPVPPLPFAAGARDLRIELRRGGSVRASIVVGSQIEAFCLQPLLVPSDRRGDAKDLPDYARFNPDLDSRVPVNRAFVGDDPLEQAYTWPAVEPGRYRLEVHTRGMHRPWLSVADVVIADGERNDEARLQHLVVPGLRTIELTLPQAASATRNPGTMGVGIVAVLDGDTPGEPCWQVDNAMVLFASPQPIDVLVRLNGYRDRVVRGLVGKQTIELEPGVPVVLRVPNHTPPAGHTLQFSLEAIDDAIARAGPAIYSAAAGGALPGYRRLQVTGPSDAGACSLRLPVAGRYRITAELRRPDGATSVLAVQPAERNIGADGDTFTVEISTPR